MDYPSAVAAAPPGWRRHSLADIDRLPESVRAHEVAIIPPHDLGAARAGDGEAEERVLRAMFWPLTYHLDPELWDALAAAEPIHPDLLEALALLQLKGDVLEVGAGSGRLTAHLVGEGRRVTAVEPASGLRALLTARLPEVTVFDAWSDALPFAANAFDVSAACGFGSPEADQLAELRRVTRRGGRLVLVNPEQPERFAAEGWTWLTFAPLMPPPHPTWIDELFGPPDPPRQLLVLELT